MTFYSFSVICRESFNSFIAVSYTENEQLEKNIRYII